MYTVIDGINFKIARAEEHLTALQIEMAKYYEAANSNPNVVSIKDKGDSWEFTLGEVLEPNMTISGIVGDCVTNLRAPLDYIMRALYESVVGLLDLDDWSPLFPICKGLQQFSRQTRRAGFNISAPVISEMEAVQPFPNNNGYKSLAILQTLTNRDKHRLPLLTMIFGGHTFNRLTIGESSGAGALTLLGCPKSDFPDNYSPSNLDMDIELSGFVALSDPGMPREPLDVTIRNIVVTVRDRIIPRFKPLIV